MTRYVEVRGGTPGVMGARGYGVQATWTIHRADCGKIARRMIDERGVTDVEPPEIGWALAKLLRYDDGTKVCTCARGRD